MDTANLTYRILSDEPFGAVLVQIPSCPEIMLREFNIKTAWILLALPVPAISGYQSCLVSAAISLLNNVSQLIRIVKNPKIIIDAIQRCICGFPDLKNMINPRQITVRTCRETR